MLRAPLQGFLMLRHSLLSPFKKRRRVSRAAASLACICLLLSSAPSFALDEALALQVSRTGDIEMSCGEISQEAALMRDIITTTQGIQDNTDFKDKSISAVGAVGSFFVSTVTGGAGIAAVGYLLKDANEDTAEKAEGVQDIAEQRRSFMTGIYNAKGCAGPIEHAFRDDINTPDTNQDSTSLARRDTTAQALSRMEPAAGSTNDFND